MGFIKSVANFRGFPKLPAFGLVLRLTASLSCFLWPSGTLCQYQSIKFEHVSLEQGLSESSVRSMLQDSREFMWFATDDGLNRFDGYSFKIYRLNPDDPNTIGSNVIRDIHQDRFGAIWVATNGGGLNRFERSHERFIRYQYDPDNPGSLSSNYVWCIYEDQSGTLWIGTDGGGLNKMTLSDQEAPGFVSYRHDPNDPNSLSDDRVLSICEDDSGLLWIGTRGGGVNRFDPATEQFVRFGSDPKDPGSLSNDHVWAIYKDRSGTIWVGTEGGGLDALQSLGHSDVNSLRDLRSKPAFKHYRHDPNDPGSISDDRITSIFEDQSGALWFGTNGGGLNKLERSTGRFTRYQHDANNPTSLSNNHVWSIFQDSTGLLWFGTEFSGINKLDKHRDKFYHYKNEPGDPNSLNDNSIWSFYQDRNGILWIGTRAGGLNRLDRTRNQFRHYQYHANNPFSLSHNHVRVIYEDRAGQFWIGTDDGLNKFEPATGRFFRYKKDPGNPRALSGNRIYSILEDRTGRLWMATRTGGINLYQRETDEFISYKHDPANPNSLSDNFVYKIFEDRAGVLWFGTFTGGLDKLVSGGGASSPPEFIHYAHNINDSTSLSNNCVLTIYEDRTGAFWLGTAGGGLNRFNRADGTFLRYNKDNGLANDFVYGILEDDQGHLWISTNRGISHFDPQTESFKNYDARDGLQSNEFNGGAYYQNQIGEMFFGGINGFNVFLPGKIKDNPFIPQVVITDFQIFNESVPVSEDNHSPLRKSITETREIKLSHKDQVFSFEFAALNFTIPEKNQYKYKMEGFDDRWIDAGTRRFVTYTNLDPGEYVFRVQGSNNDGVWNKEGTSIKITILPAIWQTWWFRLLVTLFIFLIVFALYESRVSKIKSHKKELEIQIEEKTKAAQALGNALAEVERLKNRLQAENVYLQDEIKLVHNFEHIITRSHSFRNILRSVEQVASTDATVLILGESGTGKELLARAVHNISPRGERPLVKVNCSALPANLIESELFGHEKGAFTGALTRKIGRFELANGGTIFLDEIGDLPPELQSKLLRVLQEGEFERVGSSKTIKVDVRVIAATNRDIEMETRAGHFREDLFYRLNVFPIRIPPLRARKEDIPLLVQHFIKKYGRKIGKNIDRIPQDVLDRLQSYHWPGNVRELENIIERAVILTSGQTLELGDWLSRNSASPAPSPERTLAELERQHIIETLEATGWRVSGERGAARILGINPKTLESRMKKLHIERTKS